MTPSLKSPVSDRVVMAPGGYASVRDGRGVVIVTSAQRLSDSIPIPARMRAQEGRLQGAIPARKPQQKQLLRKAALDPATA